MLVAQLEEHRPSKARVGGSNPSWHTNIFMVDVAQLVRAPDCGSGGRGFETHLPPHNGVSPSG